MREAVPHRPLEHTWVRWIAKQHMDDVTPANAVSLSTALKSLRERKLIMVRRNEGGRAYSACLSSARFDYAMRLLDGT